MPTSRDPAAARNRKVGLMAAGFAALMLGLGFASVPLYRLFCQVTGFAGTTQRVDEAQAAEVRATADTISIRFDANVDRGLPWQFKPEQITQTVSLGGRRMAIYTSRNVSGQPITGRATFNVEPAAAGKYFNKVQCFCFTEQTLQPGQEVRMPVVFFVDPKIKDDPDARDIAQITLSYTFYAVPSEASAEAAKALDQGKAGG